MYQNEKASPFSENGRGSNNITEYENNETRQIKKGIEQEFPFNKPGVDTEFPMEILPDFYKDLCMELKTSFEYPPEYTVPALLFLISTVLGNKVNLEVKEGWHEKSNLFIALVGKKGLGKSHPVKWMLRPLQNIDSKLHEQFEKCNAEYEAEKEDDSSLTKPELKQNLINDATIEAIMKTHSVNEKGVGVYADELKGFIESLNKYRNGNDIETVLSLYSGTPITINRVTKRVVRLEDSHLGIMGTIQPELLSKVFRDELMDNGLFDRFLFSMPKNLKRVRWREEKVDRAFVDSYEFRIRELYNFADSMEGSLILEFTPEARKFLFHWQNNNPEEFDSNLERGAFIKLENYVPRFCILLHVLHNFSVDELTTEIQSDIVIGAMKLSEYFYNNVLRVEEQLNKTYYDGLPKNKQNLFDILPKQFRTGDGVRIAIENQLLKERAFKTFLKDKRLFRKVDYGIYEKLIV